MNKLLILTKVMLKTSMSDLAESLTPSKNRLKQFLLMLVFVLAFVPLMIMLYLFYDFALGLLVPLDQVSVLTNIVLASVTILTFILSLIQIPSIYYYAQDTENYLVLPVKPYQILGAKFINTLAYQYLWVVFMILPLAVAMLQVETSPLFYITLLIITLFLPVLPLLLSSLVVILLMNFVPLLKNKGLMNTIIGMITILFSLALSFSMNSMGDISQEAILELLYQGNDSIAKLMFTFIPTIQWSAQALKDSNLLSLLLVIGLNIGLFILYCFFAQGFYLNGAQGIHESSRSKHVLSSSKLSKAITMQSQLSTLVKRELYVLFRTPAYLLNCVGIAVLLPAILFGSVYFSAGLNDPDIVLLQQQVSLYFAKYSNAIFIAITSGFAIGIFSGGINSISSTAISRDAHHLDALKSYPLATSTIIMAKILSGTIIAMVTNVLIMVMITFFIKLPWYFYLLYLAMSFFSSFAINCLSIIVDLIKPKLTWTNETQAVKQNINSFFSIIVAMVIPGLYGYIIINYSLDVLLVLVLTIAFNVLMIGIYWLTIRLTRNSLLNYL